MKRKKIVRRKKSSFPVVLHLVYIVPLSLVLLVIVAAIWGSVAGTDRGPDFNVPGNDLTIFRTVNNLSCHPQNPLLMELPVYNLYNPDGLPTTNDPAIITKLNNNGVKGYCVSMHAQADPNVVGIQVGSPDWTNTYNRPKIPYRHYLIYEFPNPAYCDQTLNPSCKLSKFSGKYIHWEGYTNIFEIAIGSGGEVWYPKDRIGAMTIGQNKLPTYPEVLGTKNGTTIRTSYIINNSNYSWQTCSAGAGVARPGDQGIPCFTFTVNGGNHTINGTTYDKVYNNPANHKDVPHTVRGKPLAYPTAMDWRNDDNWVRCKSELQSVYNTSYQDYKTRFINYVDSMSDPSITTKSPAPEVFPVIPASCEYDEYNPTIDPGRKPSVSEMTTTITASNTSQPVTVIDQTASPTPTPALPTAVLRPSPTPTSASGDVTPPSLSITSPTNGTVFAHTVSYTTINAKASDSTGLSEVRIYLDNVLIQTCPNPVNYSVCSYFWNGLSSTSVGTHVIRAEAVDKSPHANVATASITVTRN